jgi:GNAT superfamily N-acetyltransferase
VCPMPNGNEMPSEAIRPILPLSAIPFPTLYDVFKDVIFNPTEAEVSDILAAYSNNPEMNLYGFFNADQLLGIIGIRSNGEIEIAHLGVHPLHRNQKIGSKLIRFILSEYRSRKHFLYTPESVSSFTVLKPALSAVIYTTGVECVNVFSYQTTLENNQQQCF